jgi:hypothetical protein
MLSEPNTSSEHPGRRLLSTARQTEWNNFTLFHFVIYRLLLA